MSCKSRQRQCNSLKFQSIDRLFEPLEENPRPGGEAPVVKRECRVSRDRGNAILRRSTLLIGCLNL
ncbi:hypothetical protein Pyn_18633 [Prunus yedoensis var. nudiflora]|uniref:Uncharacterized protein n=1 Tax=Prunus yedoensis var. nudiflora TaxID=2094558 RepID=A0A314Z439_PRUYE|nr:hypothetical protein Pyn_18633 [Prunus yedoensis var. nudiflora]